MHFLHQRKEIGDKLTKKRFFSLLCIYDEKGIFKMELIKRKVAFEEVQVCQMKTLYKKYEITKDKFLPTVH